MDLRIPLLVIELLTVAGSLGESLRVVCDPQTICALQESEVKLRCSYSNTNIRAVFWFSSKQKAKWRNEEHPEDLTLDSDYAGRVNYTETTSSSLTLTIRELRERDSGEYQLLIITDRGETHLSSAAVSLMVTDLQVKLNKPQTLTCRTSCPLTSARQLYYWYKDGQYTGKNTSSSNPFSVPKGQDGSYSCSALGYNSILSRPLCVSGPNCWNVTYTDRRVCVSEGSSVDFPCTYSYPSGLTITEVFWHYSWTKEPENLSEEEQFAGRVEFIGDKKRNCTLRLRDVRKADSGSYYFRITTGTHVFSGKPGVILNVTDLQVRVSSSTASSDGQTVTLSCSSTCTLPNNPTYTWYKNGQPVTNKPSRDNKLYLNWSEVAGIYSCAVRGLGQLHSPELTLSGERPPENLLLMYGTVGAAVCLALVLLLTAALWMWRRKSRSSKEHMSTAESRQVSMDEVHYSSIRFPQSSHSTQLETPREAEHVQYAALKFSRNATVNR
ncbi:sialoadhesin-like [Salminus brasiliensis]|uniref:sialoadhesin-like n=1 Tax=Salminus brasiliensis TaxID=930266 RepID=UPI003B83910B